jgi:MFS family permease
VTKVWSLKRFRILVLVIGVAGMSQGLLIPLLSTLLDERGTSPSWNGFSAAMLYVGIMVMAPLAAGLVIRIGYRASIALGLGMTTAAVLFFPVFTSYWCWTVLRFFVGVGDSLLHYATQLWITTTAPEKERGKRISQYGFAYGLGFGIGPLGMNLLPFGFWVPFLALLSALVISLVLLFRLDAGRIKQSAWEGNTEKGNVLRIYRVAFVALCPALLYGILEAALAGSFPLSGLRAGISQAWISILISAFVWGSLLFQIPLGSLGDRISRRRLLIGICLLGGIGMASVPIQMPHVGPLIVTFALVGGLLGSLFSIGLAYLTDLLPERDLPKANAIASIHFSLGSMIGPYLGGLLIERLGSGSPFWFISFILFAFVGLASFYREDGRVRWAERKTA